MIQIRVIRDVESQEDVLVALQEICRFLEGADLDSVQLHVLSSLGDEPHWMLQLDYDPDA